MCDGVVSYIAYVVEIFLHVSFYKLEIKSKYVFSSIVHINPNKHEKNSTFIKFRVQLFTNYKINFNKTKQYKQTRRRLPRRAGNISRGNTAVRMYPGLTAEHSA